MAPATVILCGSRAAGDHRPDSDVDLMAIAPDEATLREADETLRLLLEGKYDTPVVNVITMTREKFLGTAPLAQSMAGQAARHGVTPEGKSLNYRPEREPTPEEIREEATMWLTLAETHLQALLADHRRHVPLHRRSPDRFIHAAASSRAGENLVGNVHRTPGERYPSV